MTKKIFLIFISIILLSGCEKRSSPAVITPSGERILIEIADTPEEQSQGLMFRKELGQNSGMLFVFEEPRRLSFWMKNTLIPLDAVFMDENKTIVDIKTMPPCPAESSFCPGYPSQTLAKFVLEINAGRAQALELKIGDQLTFLLPSDDTDDKTR